MHGEGTTMENGHTRRRENGEETYMERRHMERRHTERRHMEKRGGIQHVWRRDTYGEGTNMQRGLPKEGTTRREDAHGEGIHEEEIV